MTEGNRSGAASLSSPKFLLGLRHLGNERSTYRGGGECVGKKSSPECRLPVNPKMRHFDCTIEKHITTGHICILQKWYLAGVLALLDTKGDCHAEDFPAGEKARSTGDGRGSTPACFSQAHSRKETIRERAMLGLIGPLLAETVARLCSRIHRTTVSRFSTGPACCLVLSPRSVSARRESRPCTHLALRSAASLELRHRAFRPTRSTRWQAVIRS